MNNPAYHYHQHAPRHPVPPLYPPPSQQQMLPTHYTNVNRLLRDFNALIVEMGEFPAKDKINALTTMSENCQFARDIVHYMASTIRQVSANKKLPLFYLMDSILKNVGGPYIELFGAEITTLYSSCVSQVTGKDLRRFIHVLKTWESVELFSRRSCELMRRCADRAIAAESGSTDTRSHILADSDTKELRRLLTKLQNEMNIHPTKHMSLEEVQEKNPVFYQQLLDYREASISSSSSSSRSRRAPPVNNNHHPIVETTQDQVKRSPAQQLLHLLKQQEQKQQQPTPAVPNATAVFSILQKLKGTTTTTTAEGTAKENPSSVSCVLTIQKHRVEANIQTLYAQLPYVCRETGIRFRTQESLDRHNVSTGSSSSSRSWFPTRANWVSDFSSLLKTHSTCRSNEDDQNTLSSSNNNDHHTNRATGHHHPTGSFFEYQKRQEELERAALSRMQHTDSQSYVVVVDDTDDSATSHCRICGERFEKSWLEEEEEWVYPNAVMGTIALGSTSTPGGKTTEEAIFHHHCYEESASAQRPHDASGQKSVLLSQLIHDTFDLKTPVKDQKMKRTLDNEEEDVVTREDQRRKIMKLDIAADVAAVANEDVEDEEEQDEDLCPEKGSTVDNCEHAF